MPATSLTDVAARLLANVECQSGQLAESVMKVPVERYLSRAQWQSEMDEIFLKVPLVACLSIDIAAAGDHSAWELAGRKVITMRGDDGVARSFLNVCRHRGANLVCEGFGHARRLTCPYHFWSYDPQGALVGITGRELFGDIGATGLIELPTAERAGIVFSILTPGLPIDIDEWLGDMGSALDLVQLDRLHRYEVSTTLESGNWKATADGYLDGYHLGYLHKDTIGVRSITNRNTYDIYGPHVRVGFANKPIIGMKDLPVGEWNLPEAMSLVHFLFPNVSISGQPGRRTMVSRVSPGPSSDRCKVVAYQYSREPIETDADRTDLEAARKIYEAVTRDEDFVTVIGITDSLLAIAGESMLFGRNEGGNQNLHRWIERLTAGATPVSVGG